MMTVSYNNGSGQWPTTMLRRVAQELAAGFAAVGIMGWSTWTLFDLSFTYLVQAITLYCFFSALILRFGPYDIPKSGFGTANRITLVRTVLALPLAALALPPTKLSEPILWWIIVVATIAMVLDSLDGRTARRGKSETAFGARFDMELDAFLMLALSILVWRSNKVSAWIILIGALRYIFLLAGAIWPALSKELPYSLRRKTICVIQGVVLLVCLGPIIPHWLASTVAGCALGLLVYSFAIDSYWLLKRS